MPATQLFEDLYGVTKQQALNFWASHLREVLGDKRWFQMQESIGLYFSTVLAHFCLQSIDRQEVLSTDYHPSFREFRQFADLDQIAEMRLYQLTTANNPRWMESAGAHILLYAGFFYHHNKQKHNIDFFSRMGKECYFAAAVGNREHLMRRIARGFEYYLAYFAALHKYMEEKKYIITLTD